MLTTVFAAGQAAEEAVVELPLPTWLFGVIALAVLAALLALTWAFRSTGKRH